MQQLERLVPILVLLAVVALVLGTLPKVEGLNHSGAFRRRRVLNWLPLGLTYALLYMARYNLEVAKGAFSEMRGADGAALMGNADFGVIFGAGTVVYGFSFILNGPLTDRFGGTGAVRTVYFVILLSHIVLSAVIVPLVLFTWVRGFRMEVEKHRRIARWTWPLWLYVTATGVIVYFMISPYYPA